MAVAESDEPISVRELVERTDLPKSTVSRLVAALERNALVQRESARGPLRPGPVLMRLARRSVPDRDLVELCDPVLPRLAEASGETINLAVPTPLGVEHLSQIDSRHFLGSTNWIGRRVPNHCTAVGKVFLAFGAARPERGPLLRLTAATITDPAALAVQLEEVSAARLRSRGRRARARPLGGGGAGAGSRPRGRSPPSRSPAPASGCRLPRLRELADMMLAEAAEVSSRLGYRTKARSGMTTNDEVLQGLFDETLIGNAPRVKELTEIGLENGMGPETLLYDALIPSLEEVGARFERGDYFVPEMLIAARAMQGALNILRPLLAETGAKPIGTFVMGTVKGDVHDIGKNLVNIMLEGAGFTVYDLGVNVAPETFVQQIEEHEPDIVGFSAFLTTTMPMFKANINALEKSGLRDKVIVMVGGAPVTQEYANAVGADGYAADASTAVRLAKDLIEKRRALQPA